MADGGIVAERFKTGTNVSWKYLVLDHLGSMVRLTDGRSFNTPHCYTNDECKNYCC